MQDGVRRKPKQRLAAHHRCMNADAEPRSFDDVDGNVHVEVFGGRHMRSLQA